jgi:hypothetical protein
MATELSLVSLKSSVGSGAITSSTTPPAVVLQPELSGECGEAGGVGVTV